MYEEKDKLTKMATKISVKHTPEKPSIFDKNGDNCSQELFFEGFGCELDTKTPNVAALVEVVPRDPCVVFSFHGEES